MVSKHDKGGRCWKKGQEAESQFVELARSRGFSVKDASKFQNMKEHIDFFIKKNGKRLSIEVKAQKKTNRYDSEFSQDIWIEFLNVRGDRGWLYGKANKIAFQLDSYEFLLVEREKLVTLCESLIKNAKTVYSARDARYNLYTRKGRQDLLTIITLEDIKSISHDIWVKND